MIMLLCVRLFLFVANTTAVFRVMGNLVSALLPDVS